jgi:ABC-type lipoprotein release transport system permease subunit
VGTALGTLAGWLFVVLTARHGIDIAAMGGPEVRELAIKGLNLPLLVFPRLMLHDVLSGLLAILATSFVASLWPAWHASRLAPVEAMRA